MTKISELLFLLSLILLSCHKNEDITFTQSAKKVQVFIAQEQSVIPQYETFGTVTYQSKADIFPTTEGIIQSIFIEEGMKVSKNQILATLDQKKLLVAKEGIIAEIQSKQALLKLAEEKLNEAKKSIEAKIICIKNAEAELDQKIIEYENILRVYENKQKLFEAGGITKEELDSVRTQYLSSKTKLIQTEGELIIQKIGFRDEDIINAGYSIPKSEKDRYKLLITLNTKLLEAEKNVSEAELYATQIKLKNINLLLEETFIRAPIDGIIGSRYLDIGEKANPETKIFTIFDSENVFVIIEVSEKDLRFFIQDQKAIITTEYLSDKPTIGKVFLISPFINPETRTCRIKIQIPNKSKTLTPGLFVRVKVEIGFADKNVVIPEKSIINDVSDKKYVFLVRDSYLFKKEIEVNFIVDDNVAVKKGIKQGDQVCLEPSPAFQEGMQVEIIK